MLVGGPACWTKQTCSRMRTSYRIDEIEALSSLGESSLDFELVSDWSRQRSNIETMMIAINQFLSIWHRTKSISTGGLSNLLSLGRQHISSCDVVCRKKEKTYPEDW